MFYPFRWCTNMERRLSPTLEMNLASRILLIFSLMFNFALSSLLRECQLKQIQMAETVKKPKAFQVWIKNYPISRKLFICTFSGECEIAEDHRFSDNQQSGRQGQKAAEEGRKDTESGCSGRESHVGLLFSPLKFQLCKWKRLLE